MNFIHESAMTIARSAQGNPVIATLVVILFVVGINAVEMTVEKLIWGKSFEHWLDVAQSVTPQILPRRSTLLETLILK